MARYLIEVPHADSKEACQEAKYAFYRMGSHFITHADWGCDDDVHKAWLIVELDSKEQALELMPPTFRASANVVTLQKVDAEEMERWVEKHRG